jgi:putative oxidoreductase
VLGAVVTIAEAGLGILLIVGFSTRMVSFLTAMLTLAFSAAIIFVLGVHAPLIYTVFPFSAGSFLLASHAPDNLTIDRVFEMKTRHD